MCLLEYETLGEKLLHFTQTILNDAKQLRDQNNVVVIGGDVGGLRED